MSSAVRAIPDIDSPHWTKIEKQNVDYRGRFKAMTNRIRLNPVNAVNTSIKAANKHAPLNRSARTIAINALSVVAFLAANIASNILQAQAYEADTRPRETIPKEMRASVKCQQYYYYGKKEKDAGHFANAEKYLILALKDASAARNEQASDWICVPITELQTRYASAKRYDRCEYLMKYVIQVQEGFKGKTSPKLAPYLTMLSVALTQQGKTAEAQAVDKRLSTL